MMEGPAVVVAISGAAGAAIFLLASFLFRRDPPTGLAIIGGNVCGWIIALAALAPAKPETITRTYTYDYHSRIDWTWPLTAVVLCASAVIILKVWFRRADSLEARRIQQLQHHQGQELVVIDGQPPARRTP